MSVAAEPAVLGLRSMQPAVGPLHLYCAAGDVNSLEQILRTYVNVDITDTQGNSGLHWAVMKGHAHVVRLLVDKYNANVNAQNEEGETPLFIAVREGFSDIAHYLLQNGADANIAALDGTYPLHMAAAMNRVDLARLLVSFGAWVDCEDLESETPLFYAVREEHPEMVQCLLQLGANPEHKNDDDESAYSFAKEIGSKTLVKLGYY